MCISFFLSSFFLKLAHESRFNIVRNIFVCVLDAGKCRGAHFSLRQGPSRVLLRVHVNELTARRAIWIYDVGAALISLRFRNRPSRSEHLNAKTTRSSFYCSHHLGARGWERGALSFEYLITLTDCSKTAMRVDPSKTLT